MFICSKCFFPASVPLPEPGTSSSAAVIPSLPATSVKSSQQTCVTTADLNENEAANEAGYTEGANRRGRSKPPLFVLLCLLHFDPALDWRDSVLSWKCSRSYHQRNPALPPALAASVSAFHFTWDPYKSSNSWWKWAQKVATSPYSSTVPKVWGFQLQNKENWINESSTGTRVFSEGTLQPLLYRKK